MADRTADDDVLDFLDKSGRKAKPLELGAWQGTGQQFKGLLRPSASAGRTLGLAAGGFGVLFDKAAAAGERLGMSEEDRKFREDLGLSTDGNGLGAAEWAFKNLVDAGQSAVDYWTPDAATSGAAAQTAGTVFQVIGSVPQMFGTPALFLSDAAVAPATDTVMAGGSTETALKVGGISLAANAVGMKIPAAWGNSLVTRMATGAGSNLAIGVGQDAATAGVLRADGVDELADAYDPFNPQGRVLDALMGAAFGVKAHVDARYASQAGDARRADLKQQVMDGIAADRAAVTRSQRDAVLTAGNANHFQTETMPGTPRDAAAAMNHAAAMELATAQLAAGQRVDVSGKVDLDGFHLREGLRTPADNTRWHARSNVARAIQGAADELGIDAVDLATVISYETAGTFNPDQVGPTTQWGQHKGLIQFGEPQRTKYGVRDGMSVAEQMPAVVAYLRDAGVRPGMGILDVYSAINAGKVGRYDASDANNGGAPGTVRDKVEKQMDGHRKKASAMFHSTEALDAPNFGMPETPATIPDADPIFQAIPEGNRGRETVNIDTPERRAMREQWVEEHFTNAAPPRALAEGERPIAYVMGGGGASGKGTILSMLKKSGHIPTGIVEIDPDAIKTGGHGLSGIPEYEAMRARGDGRAAAVVHEESSVVAKAAWARAVAEGRDFVLDRTLGDPDKAIKELKELAKTHEIRLFGVTVDADEAIQRAVKRAQGKGRYVPLKSQLEAHKGFARAFEEYARIASDATLFDNSGAEPVQIAKSYGRSLKILDQERYNQFGYRRSIDETAETYRALAGGTSQGDGRAGHHAGNDGGGQGGEGSSRAGSGGAARLAGSGRGAGEAQRGRRQELDPQEFPAQGADTTVTTMSATERAMADARHLPDMGDLQTNDDGTINMRASARFVAGFIEGVGPNERAAMATADGSLSQEGQSRIRNAVFARAYGDPDLVAMMAEATDANVKNVLAGMLRAAPAMARLREMIAEGGRYGPDIAPDLTAAARKFSQLRSEGMTVAAWEAQGDFFGGGMSPKARELLNVIGEHARAPKRMAEFLQRYVDTVHALGDPRQADLMGGGGDGEGAVRQASQATKAAPEAAQGPAITPENREAYEAVAAHPDLTVMDEDGNMRLASEYLAETELDTANAEQTARAMEAAASCFLRNAA